MRPLFSCTRRRKSCTIGSSFSTDFALQVCDLLADGGLGDVQLATGFAKAAVICDGAEVAQVSQRHWLCSIASISVSPMDNRGNTGETFMCWARAYSIHETPTGRRRD